MVRPRDEGSQRMLSLDVLRALAVALVLVHHARIEWLPDTAVLGWCLRSVHRAGWIGVDLFFVLSGFLISGLLFDELARHGRIRYGHFVLRRGFKIYPPFWLLLAVTVVVATLRPDVDVASGEVVRKILAEAFFVQNYFPHLWPHTWSLAAEEHFYLLLPLLLILLTSLRARGRDLLEALPRISAVLFVVILGVRLVHASLVEYAPESHFVPTHMRGDALMFGVFLSYLYRYRRERFVDFGRRYSWELLLGGVLLWAPFLFLRPGANWFVHTFGFTHAYVGAGLLLVFTVVRGVPSNLLTRPLAAFGAQSYSIYLWHVPVVVWVMPRVQAAWPGASPGFLFAVYVAVSIASGILLARLIETPVLRLRERLLPSRSRAFVPVAPTPDAPGDRAERERADRGMGVALES